ncbi:hypothetical protein OF83DRAFT_96908 [Amylostereum chailletii]|nr:hypothetical protein OF83DRAFT_96908 [Amylostereum chailletii]
MPATTPLLPAAEQPPRPLQSLPDMAFSAAVLPGLLLLTHRMHGAFRILWTVVISLFINSLEDQPFAFVTISTAGTGKLLHRRRGVQDISHPRHKRIQRAKAAFRSTESRQKLTALDLPRAPHHHRRNQDLPVVLYKDTCPALTPSCPSPTLTDSSNESLLATPISACPVLPEVSVDHTNIFKGFDEDFDFGTCVSAHPGDLKHAKSGNCSIIPLALVESDRTLFLLPASTTPPCALPELVNRNMSADPPVLDKIPTLLSPPPARTKETHSMTGRIKARMVASQRRSILQAAAYTNYSISSPPSGYPEQNSRHSVSSPFPLPV